MRRISGVVTEMGTTMPGVLLRMVPHNTGSKMEPRATWSGSAGRYQFRGVRPGRYVITAIHLDGEYRAKSIHVDTEI